MALGPISSKKHGSQRGVTRRSLAGGKVGLTGWFVYSLMMLNSQVELSLANLLCCLGKLKMSQAQPSVALAIQILSKAAAQFKLAMACVDWQI